ncbi:MAG TPA: hypothetical protein VGI64_17815 [Streptosporangiaceae bacterium]|jgi:hypothetical protein
MSPNLILSRNSDGVVEFTDTATGTHVRMHHVADPPFSCEVCSCHVGSTRLREHASWHADKLRDAPQAPRQRPSAQPAD